jgi:acetyltransferase-like isoleucine patch superfamily enzyme
VNDVILKIKRGEGPPWSWLKAVAVGILRPRPPRLPDALRPVIRPFYELHFLVIAYFNAVIRMLYTGPLFQARCTKVGRRLQMDRLPFVSGHADIQIGDDVYLGGQVSIFSARVLDHPRLIIGDRARVGWHTVINVSREVVIEEDARVAYGCRISDGDGHPLEADLRAQHKPPRPEKIKAVRICRHAWIGNGTHIMKGVTIGEGAIIGANSVVTKDIPPYCVARGNPAEVVYRNVGLPVDRSIMGVELEPSER